MQTVSAQVRTDGLVASWCSVVSHSQTLAVEETWLPNLQVIISSKLTVRFSCQALCGLVRVCVVREGGREVRKL